MTSTELRCRNAYVLRDISEHLISVTIGTVTGGPERVVNFHRSDLSSVRNRYWAIWEHHIHTVGNNMCNRGFPADSRFIVLSDVRRELARWEREDML